MSDLNAVAAELKVALVAFGIKNVYKVEPSAPELPAAIVMSPSKIDYHVNYAGHCLYHITVRVILPSTDVDKTRVKLNTYVSTGVPGSIVDALEKHAHTAWESLVVTGGAFGSPPTGEATALAADLFTEIQA